MYEALINYIDRSLEEGTSPKELKKWLLQHGYSERMLMEALGNRYVEVFHERNYEIYVDMLLFSIGTPLVLLSSLFFLHSFEMNFPLIFDYLLLGLIAMFLGLLMTDLYTRRPTVETQLIFCIFVTVLSSAVLPSVALYLQKLYDLTMLKVGNYGINVDVFNVTPNPIMLGFVITILMIIPFIVFLMRRHQLETKENIDEDIEKPKDSY